MYRTESLDELTALVILPVGDDVVVHVECQERLVGLVDEIRHQRPVTMFRGVQVVSHLHLDILSRERHLTSQPVFFLIQAVVWHTDQIRCVGLDAVSLLIAAGCQLVEPEGLRLTIAVPLLERNDLSRRGMGDLLHVERQGDGLPSS